MQQHVGFIKEKIGRSVCKAMAFRCVGEMEQEKEVQYLDMDGHYKFRKEKVKIKKWRLVKSAYFNFYEQFWELPDRVFPLKLENEVYGRGEVHLQAFDYDTGDHLFFGGLVMASPEAEPQELRRGVGREHIKSWIERNKVKGVAYGMLFLGVIVGCFIGFTIGQNAESIAHALGNIKIGG